MAVLTEEQTLLRDSAREFVCAKAPTSALRRLRDAGEGQGFDPALFSEIAQMGWTGVVIPEAYGGSAFGYLSFGLILEEMGRTLAAAPLLASALAAAALLNEVGSEAQKTAWLPKIAAGEVIATLAVDESARHDPLSTSLTAAPDGEGYVLSGRKTFVLEGMAAHLFLIAARTHGAPGEADGVTLFLARAETPGLHREARHLADSRGYAALTLDRVRLPQDAVLGHVGQGYAPLEAALDRARAGVAA